MERRKRHQAYTALDYHLSLTTYFDFFSFDTFQIAKESKYLTQLEKGKIVNSDILLLAFFSKHFKIAEVLNNFGMTKENIGEKISSFSTKEDTILENFIKKFQLSFPISFSRSFRNSRNSKLSPISLFVTFVSYCFFFFMQVHHTTHTTTEDPYQKCQHHSNSSSLLLLAERVC
jgi:hypothetical protein